MSSEDLPPPATKAAERLAVIVDAAERAALTVIDDAEKEAERYLEQAQARADRIVAERLREAADRLERDGGASPRDVDAAPGDSREPSPVESPTASTVEVPQQPAARAAPKTEEEQVKADPETPAVEALSETKPESSEPTTPGGSAAARLLATQMAVSGSSRKEIEMRLRNGFEIEDTGEILDAILGPEG